MNPKFIKKSLLLCKFASLTSEQLLGIAERIRLLILIVNKMKKHQRPTITYYCKTFQYAIAVTQNNVDLLGGATVGSEPQ